MNTCTLTITPSTAKDWLNKNLNNRPLNFNHVRMLANQIESGLWKMNGQPIIFDTSGHVMDGQHRLHAIILSNQPITSLVVYGVDADSFDSMDNNRTRRPDDALACLGVPNYKDVSTMLLFIKKYENEKSFHANFRFTQAEAVELLKLHPSAPDVVRKFQQYAKKLLPSAAVYGIAYYTKQPHSMLKDFLQQASTGVCDSATSPQARLAARFIQNKTSKSKFTTAVSQALTITAWNHYVAGKEPSCIRFSENQDFPRIK